jgi:hypothetical protein
VGEATRLGGTGEAAGTALPGVGMSDIEGVRWMFGTGPGLP